MSSIKRTLNRRKNNKKKKLAEKEMATKIALFGKLPSNCLTCDKSFDKMDKEQVKSWSVVVRDKQEKVNLYCPSCWQRAMEIIGNFNKEKASKKDGES